MIWIRAHCWSVRVRFTIIRLCLFIEIVHFTKIALWLTSEIVRILIAFVFSQKTLDNIFDSILCY